MDGKALTSNSLRREGTSYIRHIELTSKRMTCRIKKQNKQISSARIDISRRARVLTLLDSIAMSLPLPFRSDASLARSKHKQRSVILDVLLQQQRRRPMRIRGRKIGGSDNGLSECNAYSSYRYQARSQQRNRMTELDDLTVLRGTSCVEPTEHGEPKGKRDLKEDVEEVESIWCSDTIKKDLHADTGKAA